MKIKIAFLGIVFSICSLYFAPSGFMQPQETKKQTAAQTVEPSKFALLIGINEYKKNGADSVRNLRGTNNDVELMKNLLVGTYKFDYKPNAPDSPVKTLFNSQATQAGIRDAFRKQLIDNAKSYFDKAAAKDPKKGATVVFYYSGHGSKLPDQNGDETDEIDETIVPHDSTTNVATQKDIRDDEFDVWFKELKNYTSNITFIFDSCHSGTVTRGGASKSIERQIVTKKSSRGATSLTDGINIPSEESYVTVSGSLPTEESQEDPDFISPITKKPDWNGALTYNFVTLLQQDPDITYREIINRIQPAVARFRQTPQAEGDIDRTVFGSSETRGQTPVFINASRQIQKTFEGANQPENAFEIKMSVGSIVGAGKDAAIAIFAKKPGEKIRSQIGSGIVTSATDFMSTAEVSLFDKTITNMPEDAVVNIVSPSFSKGEKRIVALDFTKADAAGKSTATDKGAVILNAIEEKLKTNTMLKTVRSNDLLTALNQNKNAATKPVGDWEIAVVRGTYADFKLGNPQPDVKNITSGKGETNACSTTQFVGDKAAEPADKQEGYFLVSRYSRMPLYNLWYAADNPNAGICLATALEKHARIESLRSLSSGGSKLNTDVRVELVKLNSVEDAQGELEKCNKQANQAVVAEDTSRAPQLKPGDLYYLKITNASQRDLFVYLYSLTTSGAINLLYPPEGSAQSEKLPAGKTICTLQKDILFNIESPEKSPPGVETLKVIATKQEFPAKLLTQNAIMASRGKGASPLDQLLNQTAVGTRSGTVSFAVDEWATKNINIEIVRP